MSVIKQYILIQIKQKFQTKPLKSTLCVLSPVLIYIFSWVLSFFVEIKENNIQKKAILEGLLISTVTLYLHIVIIYSFSYDIINEKKLYRRQHLFTYKFTHTHFYISWIIIYLIYTIPTNIVTTLLIFVNNLFPNVSILIVFLSLSLYQFSLIFMILAFTAFFQTPSVGAGFNVIYKTLLIISFLSVEYYDHYRPNKETNGYNGSTSIGYIIYEFKKAQIEGYTLNFGVTLFDNPLSKKAFHRILNEYAVMLYEIILYTFCMYVTDYFITSAHILRTWTDKKNFLFYKKDSGNHKKRFRHWKKNIVLPIGEEGKSRLQEFFDWDELFKQFRLLRSKNKNKNNNSEEDDEDLEILMEEENEVEIREMGDDDDDDDVDVDDDDDEIKGFDLEQGNPLIKVENLYKEYNSNKIMAVDNVSFGIYKNEVLIITGPKDSGKSTLMNLLYGTLSSSYGNISFEDISLNYWKWKTISRKISTVPKEDYVFFENNTVLDNIKLYSNLCKKGKNINTLLKELNFKSSTSELYKNLEEAEKTKLKIAVALLKHEKYIFIEEPTTNMTKEDKRSFWQVIKSKKNEATVIISTTSLNEALKYGSRILVLDCGKIQYIEKNKHCRKSIMGMNESLSILIHDNES